MILVLFLCLSKIFYFKKLNLLLGHAASTALVPAGQLHGSTAVHGASAITQHPGGFQGSGSSAVGVAGAGGAGGGMTSQLQLLEIHNAIYSAGTFCSRFQIDLEAPL